MRFLAVCAFALAILFSQIEVIGQVSEAAKPDEDSYLQGLRHHEAGEYEDAVDAFRQAIKNRPDAAAYQALGVSLSLLDRFSEAVESLRTATRLDPTIPEAFRNLGNALSQLGRNEEAIAPLRKAAELRPGYFAAHDDLGIAYIALNQGKKALAAFDAAIKADPTLAVGHYHRGVALRKMNQRANAIEAFKRALELNPRYADAHGAIAIAYLALNKRNLAAEHYAILKTLDEPTAIAVYKAMAADRVVAVK